MFSTIIEREKGYCIDLGIDEETVNEEFQTTFSSVSEIALLRESLINKYSAVIHENQVKRLTGNPKKTEKKPNHLLDKMIRNKKNTLRDFGISIKTIDEEFLNHNIQTVRQLDILGDEMLSKHFLLMDIKDTVNSLV